MRKIILRQLNENSIQDAQILTNFEKILWLKKEGPTDSDLFLYIGERIQEPVSDTECNVLIRMRPDKRHLVWIFVNTGANSIPS